MQAEVVQWSQSWHLAFWGLEERSMLCWNSLPLPILPPTRILAISK